MSKQFINIAKQIAISLEGSLYKARTSISRKKKDYTINGKQVVFVVDHPSPRVVKMMFALKNEGYETVAICRRTRNTLVLNQILMFASKVSFYSSKEKALHECKKYSPLAYHIFCCFKYDVAEFIIRNNIGRTVFDNYDGYKGYLPKTEEKLELQEKYCLENADGLCCRSFESQYNKHVLKYKFKGKRILFLDYCWDNTPVEIRNAGNELKFFYGGGINAEGSTKSPMDCHERFAEIAGRNHACYTIYCAGYNREYHVRYEKLAQRIKGFEFNPAVPFEEMLIIARNFDYGVWIGSELYKDRIKRNDNDEAYCGIKYKYGATNKFFDYIDAGMPIIGCIHEMFFKIFERNKMAHYATIESVENDFESLRENLIAFKEAIIKNRRKFSINENIPRLIDFYKKLQ